MISRVLSQTLRISAFLSCIRSIRYAGASGKKLLRRKTCFFPPPANPGLFKLQISLRSRGRNFSCHVARTHFSNVGPLQLQNQQEIQLSNFFKLATQKSKQETKNNHPTGFLDIPQSLKAKRTLRNTLCIVSNVITNLLSLPGLIQPILNASIKFNIQLRPTEFQTMQHTCIMVLCKKFAYALHTFFYKQ